MNHYHDAEVENAELPCAEEEKAQRSNLRGAVIEYVAAMDYVTPV